jgi:hypothetical protein
MCYQSHFSFLQRIAQQQTNQTTKMKFFVVFALVIASALAVPLDSAKDAQITKLNQEDVRADGYSFA